MAGRVTVEQQLIMRRGEWCWVRAEEEEPTGKKTRRNYLLNVATGEKRGVSAKDARAHIERINQGVLW